MHIKKVRFPDMLKSGTLLRALQWEDDNVCYISLDLKERTAVLKEKKTEHIEVQSEIEDKEHHKELLIQRIEKLKKDHVKNRECTDNFLSSGVMT